MNFQTQIQSNTQKQNFAIRHIQWLNFLMLDINELNLHIEHALMENPFLCISDEANSPVENSQDNDLGEIEDLYPKDVLDDEEKYFQTQNSALQKENKSQKAAEISLKDQIMEQLSYKNLNSTQLKIAHFIIYSTDHQGFLNKSLECLTEELSFYEGKLFSEEELLNTIMEIKNCQPYGFASKNLQDYFTFLVNLSTGEDQNHISWANILLSKYWMYFESLQWDKCCSNSLEKSYLKKLIRYFKNYKPYPNHGNFEENTQQLGYLNPEYEIYFEEGKIKAAVVESTTYQLAIKKTATDKNDLKIARYLNDNLTSAKNLVAAIAQRKHSMEKVINAILAYQKEFFYSGNRQDLKPMILKNIAQITGLDVSTISRLSSQKYVQTTFGIIPLKGLFQSSLCLQNGQQKTTLEVKNDLLDIIKKENKSEPLSDYAICEILNKRGVKLERRTISKYRQQANIPMSTVRKLG